MYKLNSNAYYITFVKISHKTNKFFIQKLDFRPIGPKGYSVI